VSSNKGRRPAPGKRGRGGASGRSTDPAAVKRLGLLVFGVTFVVLFLIVAIAEGIGHSSVPSGAVAIVEDTPADIGEISNADFERALLQTAAQSGEKKAPKPGDEKYDEFKETALGGLLDMIWIQGEADEMGVSVTQKEIADELKKLKKENFKSESEYKKFLKEAKYTQADVDQRVKAQIIGTQIQKQITEGAPTPSQGEIEDYYAAAKATQFTQPATRDVRVVLNKDKGKAEKATATLEEDDSPKSWKKVAGEFSEDPTTKSIGGLQKSVSEATFEEPLGAQIFGTPENQVKGPVKTTRGYYVFEVENTNPETVQTLGDVEAQIKSQLEQQAQQESFGTFVANYTARWRSRTFCASDFTIERCANFKAAAHPSTAPPGCYEANPKEGRPDACPAPVFQLIPALPGTVTPLEPRGKPLAQRPIPASGEEPTEAPGSAIPPPTP
jgi:parvulin-like peptidyl-prolyl isomerase